ncbi:hypothetical protein VTO42DRAFT_5164 [Malbranchea cinnamomea]
MLVLARALILSLAYLCVPSWSFGLGLGIPGIDATYDYVIVGGGTAGLTIAARLAEDLRLSVAVVEAGGYYEFEGGPMSIIPGFAAAANTGTDLEDDSTIDWNFVTEPLKGANDRVLRYARGKTLGGTTARNFMIYQRGTKGSFEKWASLVGDSSWQWDSILPFYKKSCTFTPPDMTRRAPNTTVSYNPDAFDNSLKGPLKISWPNYGYPFGTYLEKGLESVGILPGVDFNSGSLNGSSWPSTTIDPLFATRSSSKTSFLDGSIGKRWIRVYGHTMAKKITFKGIRATGVQVETMGLKYTLKAKREVILSAGAFQSPQMLMVSGIGPKATLEAHGIPVIKDLPGVGQNMWDHLLFAVVHRVNVVTASRLVSNTMAPMEAMAQYALQRGPLTAPGFSVLGWEKLPESLRSTFSNETRHALDEFPDDWPEIEYIGLDGILDGWHNAQDQMLGDGYNYASVAASIMTPQSRGSVTISSPDASDPPVIDLAYLTHKADQEVAVAAVKRLRQIWAGMSEVVIGDEYRPGPEVQSDEEIMEFIKSTVVPVWHAVGTCAMGKTTDPMAVVDSNARVIGVTGLRVVDASVFPVLPPGHPQSTIYMVAEKIADAIKKGS